MGLHSLAQASSGVLLAGLRPWMLLFWLPRLQCCGHSLGQPCWSPAARRGQSRQVLGMLSLTHFGFARSAAQAFGSGLALHVTQVAAAVVDVGPLEYSPEVAALLPSSVDCLRFESAVFAQSTAAHRRRSVAAAHLVRAQIPQSSRAQYESARLAASPVPWQRTDPGDDWAGLLAPFHLVMAPDSACA